MQNLLKYIKSVKVFLGLILLGLSINLQAATLTIYSVDGVSAYDDETETTPIVYGAFSPNCNTLTGSDPSTGCAINPITSSSTFEVCAYHDDSTQTAEFSLVTATSDGDEVSLTQTQTSVSSGNTKCIRALWSSICTTLDSDNTSCADYDSDDLYLLATFADNSTLSVNIDFKINAYDTATEALVDSSSCTGETTDKPCVFSFSLVAGDAKAILMADGTVTEALSANSGFPSATDHLTTKYIRFIYAEGSSTSFDVGAAITAGNYQDIEVITDSNGNSSTATDYITGLTNDVTYTFRVATVDEAGNVGYFLDAASTDLITAANRTITPQKVYGVFEDSRCFIATAAYGNPLERHLVLLREFRDKVLKKYQWGKKFIHYYYTYSPEAAVWLLDKEVIKPIVRLILWPLYFFAKISLKYGIFFSLLLNLVFIGSIVRLLFYIRQRIAS